MTVYLKMPNICEFLNATTEKNANGSKLVDFAEVTRSTNLSFRYWGHRLCCVQTDFRKGREEYTLVNAAYHLYFTVQGLYPFSGYYSETGIGHLPLPGKRPETPEPPSPAERYGPIGPCFTHKQKLEVMQHVI